MNTEQIEKFKEMYCLVCGSQRCTGEGEWLEGCNNYREYMLNPDANNNPIVLDHLNHFDVNFRVVCQEDANKYALIDEISKWMIDYCKKNDVVIINNITGKPWF